MPPRPRKRTMRYRPETIWPVENTHAESSAGIHALPTGCSDCSAKARRLAELSVFRTSAREGPQTAFEEVTLDQCRGTPDRGSAQSATAGPTDIAAYRSVFGSRWGRQAAITGGMGCCTNPLAREENKDDAVWWLEHSAPSF